jgi:hypothetical protein
MLTCSPLQAAEELLRRRLARSSLLDFTRYTFEGYRDNWHHRLLCTRLDDFAAGKIRRLIVNMPPQHGKSELVSRRLPAYILGRDPDTPLICCSHTTQLAEEMCLDVQRIMEDDSYKRLFPGTRLPERGEGKKTSELFEVVGHRGRYFAAGVGKAIVGRGFRLGIIDDPTKGREAADSPTQREGVRKWYSGDFMTRRRKDAGILITATRWHVEDLVGWLRTLSEDDPHADKWEVLSLPAVAEEVRCEGDPREPGEALWPDEHPFAELETTKAASVYDWWSQYQQKPRAPGSTEWPDEHFSWDGFWFDRWPENATFKVMSLDPSKGNTDKAGDYQAIVVWGRTPDSTEWVEADMGKRPMVAARLADGTAITDGMVERCMEIYDAHRPERLVIESNTFQQLLTIPMRLVAKIMGVDPFLRMMEVTNKVNKEVRIRRLGDPLSRRKMRFRRTPGTRLLVEQLRQFPVADHDDGPDALEMARRIAIELWNGKAEAKKGQR